MIAGDFKRLLIGGAISLASLNPGFVDAQPYLEGAELQRSIAKEGVLKAPGNLGQNPLSRGLFKRAKDWAPIILIAHNMAQVEC